MNYNLESTNCYDLQEPQRYSVALKGHDFTGLGFNICGNMRDGIYIKDVMQRGPAAESKRIMPGKKIVFSFWESILNSYCYTIRNDIKYYILTK